VEGGARLDEQVTIQNLQKQLAAQEAELHRTGQELAREVAEHKKTEETTRSLMLLLETLDAECFIKDRDGIYQYISRAFEPQFGVKREDLIGQDDAYAFGDEGARLLTENDRRIMASRETESVEESGYLQGKGHVVYLSIKTPIIDENDNVSGICGVGIGMVQKLATNLQENRFVRASQIG
jgi:PAS domain S-box-containing protein